MHLVELSLLYFTDAKKWRSHLGRFNGVGQGSRGAGEQGSRGAEEK
ncbi:MAG: hypothetical protein RMZ41_027000 [Nostoc sp. DedVER02]|nr:MULTISPECIES: hypothetical protein [unclassified Nostoc]MDZ7988359.1 hypothetical protein [Nostoc sp. DedVER02]MDZ8115465.1 hypothetical protein [Nostoc sp. DedVER01b]